MGSRHGPVQEQDGLPVRGVGEQRVHGWVGGGQLEAAGGDPRPY